MNRELALLGGLGLGAGLMYLFDPDKGRGRRIRLRDRTRRIVHVLEKEVGKKGRDLGNRAQGLASEMLSELTCEPVTDEVLVERVRAHIGHVIAHPHNVEVSAQEGHVTLQGRLPGHDLEPLLACVRKVRGVLSVDNRMEVSWAEAPPEEIPEWQTALPKSLALLPVVAAGAALYFYNARRPNAEATDRIRERPQALLDIG